MAAWRHSKKSAQLMQIEKNSTQFVFNVIVIKDTNRDICYLNNESLRERCNAGVIHWFHQRGQHYMGMCRSIRTYSSRHEWVGNLFSLLGVALIFATVWASLHFYLDLMVWLRENPLLHSGMLVAGFVFDAALIMILLSIGSAREGEEEPSCFATFQGRRGGANPISAFSGWLQHMENVGRKHR